MPSISFSTKMAENDTPPPYGHFDRKMAVLAEIRGKTRVLAVFPKIGVRTPRGPPGGSRDPFLDEKPGFGPEFRPPRGVGKRVRKPGFGTGFLIKSPVPKTGFRDRKFNPKFRKSKTKHTARLTGFQDRPISSINPKSRAGCHFVTGSTHH